MNDKFDELAKGLAQTVTRRGALKNFGLGLAGIALASLGLANNAVADQPHVHIKRNCQCKLPDYGCTREKNPEVCFAACVLKCERR